MHRNIAHCTIDTLFSSFCIHCPHLAAGAISRLRIAVSSHRSTEIDDTDDNNKQKERGAEGKRKDLVLVSKHKAFLIDAGADIITACCSRLESLPFLASYAVIA